MLTLTRVLLPTISVIHLSPKPEALAQSNPYLVVKALPNPTVSPNASMLSNTPLFARNSGLYTLENFFIMAPTTRLVRRGESGPYRRIADIVSQ